MSQEFINFYEDNLRAMVDKKALAEVATGRHKDIVALFLDHGANPWMEPSLTRRQSYQAIQLFMPIQKGHAEIAKVLINKISTNARPLHDLWQSNITIAIAVEPPLITQLLI